MNSGGSGIEIVEFNIQFFNVLTLLGMENGVSVVGYLIRIDNVRFEIQDIEDGIRYKIGVGRFLLYELKKRDLIMKCVNSLLRYCLYYLRINFILKGFTNTETKKQLVHA